MPRSLHNLASEDTKKFVHVSCNPATLARDLKFHARFGYKVDKIQPVDMFPQTSEVEAVALLYKTDVSIYVEI